MKLKKRSIMIKGVVRYPKNIKKLKKYKKQEGDLMLGAYGHA